MIEHQWHFFTVSCVKGYVGIRRSSPVFAAIVTQFVTQPSNPVSEISSKIWVLSGVVGAEQCPC
jgi:hypothetical protein